MTAGGRQRVGSVTEGEDSPGDSAAAGGEAEEAELRDGGPKDRGGERRCIATGRVGPKAGMVRFVIDPAGAVLPDVTERLPGRGLWLTASSTALAQAIRKNRFAYAARRKVTVPEGLGDTLDRLLSDQALGLIGLAQGAGQLTVGFDRVSERLRAGPVGAVIEARDGAGAGRARLRALAPSAPVVGVFDAAELAGALGRDSVVVHGALEATPLTARIVAAADRLAGFRAPGHGT